MRSTLHFPLTEILGSRASLQVVRELHRHGGAMSVTLIVGHTGLSKRSVQLSLDKLDVMRVIDRLGTGRSVLYKMRADYPLFAPMAHLFKAEETRFQSILSAIADLADADTDILAVWLYGSVARNEDAARSDLDLTIAVNLDAAPRVQADFRERIAPFEEKLAFDASVIVLDVEEIKRLEKDADPWWVSLTREALAVRGERPDIFNRRQTPLRRKK